MIKVAPSILSCDFARLGQEAEAIKLAGGDMLHVDVMDGHFVPNISLGLPVVASLRKATDLFLDVHLMISEPLRYVEAFAEAGSDLITFHIESEGEPGDIIREIRACGKQVGITLRPGTPVEALTEYLPLVDLVLVMTVEPGFGGQSFMEGMMPKFRYISERCKALGISPMIQVDGGINAQTAAVAAANGADTLVAGSAVFGKPDYKAAIEAIRQGAEQAVGQ